MLKSIKEFMNWLALVLVSVRIVKAFDDRFVVILLWTTCRMDLGAQLGLGRRLKCCIVLLPALVVHALVLSLERGCR